MEILSKRLKNEGFIFSVYNDNVYDEVNQKNHAKVLKDIQDKSIAHKVVTGGYTDKNGNKVIEQSFYVETNDKYNIRTLHNYIRSQCLNAYQTSFLYLSFDRTATLIYLKGDNTSIGTFTSVNKHEALEASRFTYCPKIDSYFICK